MGTRAFFKDGFLAKKRLGLGGCVVKWNTKAVPPGCLKAARVLAPLRCLDAFYLAGGTALALTYGHRLSVDLDFFSPTNPLGLMERPAVLESLRSAGAEIEEEKDGTLHARLRGTHISFFRYRYPLLRGLRRWGHLRVAHPVDIGLMKLGAIIGRGSRKDFVDLYVILKEEMDLPRLLRLAPKKFPGSRDFRVQALRALVYFADADQEPDLRLPPTLSWPGIKRFFENEVRSLSQTFR